MLPVKICFVDIETTGHRGQYDRIIEIGIIQTLDGKIVNEFQSLINPMRPIPPEITFLTGISAQDLEHAPNFSELSNQILMLLKDHVFVAHNVRFDYGFLKHEFYRLGISFAPKHFCTVKLSRTLFPRFTHHNLDAIIKRFNLSCNNRHRAFDDAKVIYDFYRISQEKFPQEVFLKAVNKALKKPTLPIGLQLTDLDSLPEQPGVYLFYGALPATNSQAIPLYIGKSKNIRERVLSHFAADLRSGIEMKIAQQINRIETIQTAGELGALFTESQLIKKLLPLYNKRLRQKHTLMALRQYETPTGYKTITIEPVEILLPSSLSDFMGFFRSKREAKEFLSNVSEEYCLCNKLLGLEKTETACFSYRLDKCKGACLKKELPLSYNMRFVQAFSKTKIKPWPFSGPIVIQEINNFTQKKELFFVDKWCVLGSLQYDEFGNQTQSANANFQFDLDIYKILWRFMNTPNKMHTIRNLSQEELRDYGFS